MTWIFVTGVLPLVVSLGQWGLRQFGGSALGSAGFWEALAAYIVVQLGLPPLLALRERRLRRTGELL